jgi:hypothetical protein
MAKVYLVTFLQLRITKIYKILRSKRGGHSLGVTQDSVMGIRSWLKCRAEASCRRLS